MRLHSLSPSTTSRRSAVLWSGVPVLAAVTGVLGLRWSAQLSAAGALDAQELSLAVTAAAACLAVAAWWLGGLVMAGVALVAHRLRWRGAERWARRLTPALIARTTAALVGSSWSRSSPPTPQTPPWTRSGVHRPRARSSSRRSTTSCPHRATPPCSRTSPGPAARVGQRSPGQPRYRCGGSGLLRVSTLAAPPRTTTPAPLPERAPAPERVIDGSLTVVRGDTLWDLTEQLLGARATDEDVS